MIKKDNICKLPYCSRPKGHGNICHFHHTEKTKSKNPIKYHFGVFRRNARRRGKEFSLTLEQYTEIANKYGLFDCDGNKDPRKTMDRIRPGEGYHFENVQVLTNSENSRKKYTDYYMSQYDKMSPEEIEWNERRRESLRNDNAKANSGKQPF